jgi:hypothetical protein
MHRGCCAARVGFRPLWLLREATVPPDAARGSYESEGSERVSRGSITLPSGACWLSKLEVPMNGDNSALLTVRRQAPGPSLAPDEASLVVPPNEAGALLALLEGLFAQARRDGVITGSDAP